MIHPLEIFGFSAVVYFVFRSATASLGHRWNLAPKINQSVAF